MESDCGGLGWVLWVALAEMELGVQKGRNICERKWQGAGLVRRRSQPVI